MEQEGSGKGSGNHRGLWSSKFGFIMAAAGSAVGLGNIWRFPYITGKYGGAAFVLVYLVIIFVIGASVMLAEFSLGRAGRLNAVGSFRCLAEKVDPQFKRFWPLVGWVGVLAGTLILSYYAVIGGWTIAYMVKSFTGLMGEAGAGKAGDIFGAFVSDWKMVVFYQVAFMAIAIWIVYQGIGKGIEKYCKVMMPGLFLILIILIFRSVTLEGAEKGLNFYLSPDFSKITGESFLAALGQAFFSLSLGMGIAMTYGSYIPKDQNLVTSVGMVTVIDTAVALLAGLVIFPAVFAFGVEPGAGPGLTFVTLPSVFAQMPAGHVFSALFFLLLFLAAMTSAISLLEVSVSYVVDQMGLPRGLSTLYMGIAITLVGVPSSMSLGGHFPKIFGKDFLDAMDFLTNNVMLCLCALFTVLFAGWLWYKDARAEITVNGKYPFALYTPWIWVCRVIAPAAIGYIFVMGLKW